MNKTLILFLFISLFALNSVIAENSRVPRGTLLDAYYELPEDPGFDHKGSFYSEICSKAIADFNVPFTEEYVNDFCRHFEYFGFHPDDIQSVRLDTGGKHDQRARLVMGSVIKLALFAKAAEPVPADLAERRVIIAAFFANYVRTSINDNLSTKLNNWCSDVLKDIEYLDNIHSFMATYDNIVKKYMDELPITGENLAERVKSWAEIVDKTTAGPVEASAFVRWLWENVKPEDVLINLPEGAIPFDFEARMDTFVSRYSKPWFLPTREGMYSEGGMFSDNTRDSERIRAHFIMAQTAKRFLRAEDAPIGRALFFCSACYSPGEGFYYRTCIPDSVRNATDEYLRMTNGLRYGLNSDSGRRIVEKSHGRCKGGWFLGDAKPDALKGEKSIRDDFIYPFVLIRFFENGMIGFPKFLSRRELWDIMGELPWFTWNPREFKSNEPPRKEGVRAIDRKVGYDYSDEAIEQMKGNGMLKRFSANTGVNYMEQKPDFLRECLRPAVFYHFDEVCWTLYEVWDYDSETQSVWLDLPLTLLVFYPPEDAIPDGVMAGMRWVEFRQLQDLCGIYRLGARMWNIEEFLQTEDGAKLVKEAQGLADEKADGYEERFENGVKELERRRIELYGYDVWGE